MSHYIIMLALIIYAILMYLYIHTFYYLKKAEQTGCFNSKVNLKYMQFFQIIEIIAVTLTVILLPSILSKPGKRIKNINIALFMIIVVLGINAYMAVNVYQFYIQMNNCPIMNTWNKWWLYWEGIAATISSVRGILVVGLVLSIIAKRLK